MGEEGVGKKEEGVPLFETREARFRGAYKVFATTIFASICLIWFYRATHIPGSGEQGRWGWIGLFMAELCFGFYWVVTQSARWRLVHQSPFKQRLSTRYEEDKLPGVDIFVCTADPLLEPPSMVMNTVLSAMSFNYPSHKLSVYLSDDGASELTFYALLKASMFSKHWIPFCRRFNIQPRSPEAYFAQHSVPAETTIDYGQEWSFIKRLYEDMKSEIESAVEKGKRPEDIRNQHVGFSEWDAKTTKQNHQSIVQVVIDGRDKNTVDDDGYQLPTVVYMAREKRPNTPHHFKAGAMNALIRVSSEISNAPFILNLDCDMYPNNVDIIQEVLCFFLDEARGHEIAYVQFPQYYNNVTKNDIYANSYDVINKVELAGICGNGATLYCGTGCFHRRESLSGMYFKDYRANEWNIKPKREDKRTMSELSEASKALANCTYEKGTLWGKEKGLLYGIPVEDVATGLVITCRGWKSIYYNPKRKAFLGVAPTSLDVALVQQKRWSEGLFQIFFSKYCPFIYGHGKINLGLQMGYCVYLLWAPTSLPTLCYVIVPPICLLCGISLFPQLTSLWLLPFAYAFVATNAYSLCEGMSCGSTAKSWWNLQRMKLIRRTTSYLFGFIDTISRRLGLSETKFAITDKAVTEDGLKRYEQEVIDFGGSSVMLTIIATLALLNFFCLIGGIGRILMYPEFNSSSQLILQIVLCTLMIMINLPVFEALFIRNDQGCIPSTVMLKSIVLASLACCLAPFIIG